MTAREDWPQHIARLVATNRLQDETITDLLEALEAITMGRHTHSNINVPDGYDCADCKQGVFDVIHYRVGESEQADLAVARTAIQKAKGGSE